MADSKTIVAVLVRAQKVGGGAAAGAHRPAQPRDVPRDRRAVQPGRVQRGVPLRARHAHEPAAHRARQMSRLVTPAPLAFSVHTNFRIKAEFPETSCFAAKILSDENPPTDGTIRIYDDYVSCGYVGAVLF